MWTRQLQKDLHVQGVGTEADYYSILGIDRDAGLDVVRETYRRLMQHSRIHPDLGGDTQKAALINKAYAVLSNPELRSEYDARLTILERVAQGFAAPPREVIDPAKACAFCGEPHAFSQQHDDLSDRGCERCGSALQAAVSERLESLGQRAVQRLGRSYDLTMFTRFPQARGVKAQTEDISLQGLRLTTRADLYLGQRIRLVSDAFDAVGQVVHRASNTQGWFPRTIAGVTFVTLRFSRPAGVFVSRQI